MYLDCGFLLLLFGVWNQVSINTNFCITLNNLGYHWGFPSASTCASLAQLPYLMTMFSILGFSSPFKIGNLPHLWVPFGPCLRFLTCVYLLNKQKQNYLLPNDLS